MAPYFYVRRIDMWFWILLLIGLPVIAIGCVVIWYLLIPIILIICTLRKETKASGFKVDKWKISNEKTYDLLLINFSHDGIVTKVNTAIPHDDAKIRFIAWEWLEAMKLTLKTAIPAINRDRSMTEYSIELGLDK